MPLENLELYSTFSLPRHSQTSLDFALGCTKTLLNHLTTIIMKRINLLLFISLLFSSVSMAQEPYSIPESSLRIEFVCEHINNNAGQVGRPRTPIQPPTVYLCDHTLYICGDYGDFSLQVLTDDETAVYSAYVTSGTTEVQLPATLSGDYVLQLECGNFLFTGEIAL